MSKSIQSDQLVTTCLTHTFDAGNSPVMISKEQIEPIVKIWSNISLQIKQDSEADKTWGWVQEM